LLGGFTWKLFALKAQVNTFIEGAIADLAKLIRSRHAANTSIWAGAFRNFWAFLAGNTANTNPHI
jgi:hypothetical protein